MQSATPKIFIFKENQRVNRVRDGVIDGFVFTALGIAEIWQETTAKKFGKTFKKAQGKVGEEFLGSSAQFAKIILAYFEAGITCDEVRSAFSLHKLKSKNK